jgi:hypothetical protein
MVRQVTGVQLAIHGYQPTLERDRPAPAGPRPPRRIVVQDVVITGSAGVGVYVHGASDFRLTDVPVSDSRADGIHMTAARRTAWWSARSSTARVTTVSRSCPYQDDPGVTRRIEVDEPR